MSNSRPFYVSEGTGRSLKGRSFTLAELFESGIVSSFDREESTELFKRLSTGYQKGVSGRELAHELVEYFSKIA